MHIWNLSSKYYNYFFNFRQGSKMDPQGSKMDPQGSKMDPQGSKMVPLKVGAAQKW